ncbi:MAG: helix-turn-helix domain-containing protein [Lachnospiraceae bacterium]|jgi:two-component system response regulator YesN|nr:helix-turn-helix domain-containing protein [Lachnospiraceae bacterium]
MELNIVVVDDETPICEWLLYCIRRASKEHQVVCASNGDEALGLILTEKPDLVFTDIRMPGIDGLELMRRVREILPFTVFAILSNYAEFTYAKQALSIGAREYFLKSELRAANIETLLSQVAEEKERKRRNKTEDTFRSGCIDLYNYYRTQNEPDFADRFWERQGMAEDLPYTVLCFPAGKSQDDWTKIARLAESWQSQMGEGSYAAVACERGFDYLILQTGDGLERWEQKAAEQLRYRGGIGLSQRMEKRGAFPSALKQAGCAQAATFFSEEGSPDAVYYSSLESRPALEREYFQNQKKEVLDRIAARRFGQAQEAVAQCFAAIASPAAGDVIWAADYCRRMVLSVEERYFEQSESSPQAMEAQNTLWECARRCDALLEAMKSRYTGRCSPPVCAALEYVHGHYAEQISMAEVAQYVFWSPEYFSRQFKEEVGENFNAYLTIYRLDRAQELLRQTDLRISEVADRVGYASPGYFSRMYKRYKGVTPEKEREREK